MKKGWIKEEEEQGIPWRWDVRESKKQNFPCIVVSEHVPHVMKCS
jgi:hypothetical protein